MCVWVCVHDEEREMQVREEGREVGNGDASQQTRRGLAEKCVCEREREGRMSLLLKCVLYVTAWGLDVN